VSSFALEPAHAPHHAAPVRLPPARLGRIGDSVERVAPRLAVASAPGLLQRSCACGGVPGLDGECAECRARRYALSGEPAEAASDELEVHISQSTDAGPANGPVAPQPAAPTCPATISVAEITPVALTAGQIGSGVRAGWGAITRMEVSGGGRTDWDGTRVTEHLTTGTNDCDKSPACANTSGQGGNAGSTWTVGRASPAFNHPKLGEVVPAMAAKKNCFYDIHVQGGSVDWCAASGSCTRSCEQHFKCGRTTFGPTFVVSWSFARASRKDADGNAVSVCAPALTKTVKAPSP
jgi:hypothetical protein